MLSVIGQPFCLFPNRRTTKTLLPVKGERRFFILGGIWLKKQLIKKLSQDNASYPLAACILLLATLMVGGAASFVMDIPWSELSNSRTFWEIIWIPVGVVGFLVVHELIHIAFYLIFGKGEAKIKVSRERKVGAIVMHQTNDSVLYTRWQMVIILLSPLVLLTGVFLLLHLIIPAPFFWWANLVLNATGSSIDLYVVMVLASCGRGRYWVNLHPEKVQLQVYKRVRGGIE